MGRPWPESRLLHAGAAICGAINPDIDRGSVRPYAGHVYQYGGLARRGSTEQCLTQLGSAKTLLEKNLQTLEDLLRDVKDPGSTTPELETHANEGRSG